MTYNEAYGVLGVKAESSSNEIKEAYKRQAKKYHPDIYKGEPKFAEERMKLINEAYTMLTVSKTSSQKSNYSSYAECNEDMTKSYEEFKRASEKYQKYYENYRKAQEELRKMHEENKKALKKKVKVLLSILTAFLLIAMIVIPVYGIRTIAQFYSESMWWAVGVYILVLICQLLFIGGVIISLWRIYRRL